MRIVTTDFAGAAYPPGTKVSFTTKTGRTLHGIPLHVGTGSVAVANDGNGNV